MFPHTITIFNHVYDRVNGDVYHRYVLNGVYWYGSKGITNSGKGIEKSDEINILIPKDALANYSETYISGKYTLSNGDRIVKGNIGSEITSVNELSTYKNVITITDISDNRCDSNLDNIIVRGR